MVSERKFIDQIRDNKHNRIVCDFIFWLVIKKERKENSSQSLLLIVSVPRFSFERY